MFSQIRGCGTLIIGSSHRETLPQGSVIDRPEGRGGVDDACAYREHGLWGAVARTNGGPEDPVWHEYAERLQRANAVFLGEEQ